MSSLSALIVSVANVCRAPLAAAVFREVARARARGAEGEWRATSAGLDPWYAGMAVDPRVTGALRPVLSTADLWRQTTTKTRLVRPADFLDFDYILAVDTDALETLRTKAPEQRVSRVLLLPAFDSEKEDRILHPDDEEGGGFDRCLSQCVRSCNGFLEQFDKKLFLDSK